LHASTEVGSQGEQALPRSYPAVKQFGSTLGGHLPLALTVFVSLVSATAIFGLAQFFGRLGLALDEAPPDPRVILLAITPVALVMATGMAALLLVLCLELAIPVMLSRLMGRVLAATWIGILFGDGVARYG
jgi:hypothetical protein